MKPYLKTRITSVILAVLFIFSSTKTLLADALICEKQMVVAAKKHGVPIGILYAVALTETGRRNSLHPYALNIHGKSLFPRSENEAIRLFEEARAQGQTLIDLGCMQINHHYHSRHFSSIRKMLDPALNVNYAALFLKKLFKQEGSWTLAAARYHAGPKNLKAQKRYVCAVISNLVASGFGNWTKNAKMFCN